MIMGFGNFKWWSKWVCIFFIRELSVTNFYDFYEGVELLFSSELCYFWCHTKKIHFELLSNFLSLIFCSFITREPCSVKGGQTLANGRKRAHVKNIKKFFLGHEDTNSHQNSGSLHNKSRRDGELSLYWQCSCLPISVGCRLIVFQSFPTPATYIQMAYPCNYLILFTILSKLLVFVSLSVNCVNLLHENPFFLPLHKALSYNLYLITTHWPTLNVVHIGEVAMIISHWKES